MYMESIVRTLANNHGLTPGDYPSTTFADFCHIEDGQESFSYGVYHVRFDRSERKVLMPETETIETVGYNFGYIGMIQFLQEINPSLKAENLELALVKPTNSEYFGNTLIAETKIDRYELKKAEDKGIIGLYDGGIITVPLDSTPITSFQKIPKYIQELVDKIEKAYEVLALMKIMVH